MNSTTVKGWLWEIVYQWSIDSVPVHKFLSSGVWLVYHVIIVDKPVHSTSTVAHGVKEG